MLYSKGKITHNDYCLAVIGSRDCSLESKKKLFEVIKKLPQNIVIVSGLAIGIDTCAHLSALKTGKKTIAVLPCGIETIYPKQNITLSQLIIQKGGAIVSEYEGKMRPTKKSFILRNKVIADLSNAVLVAEAQIKSGTMTAVNFALKQNKPIYAIPGSAGTNYLLENKIASDLPLLFKNVNN